MVKQRKRPTLPLYLGPWLTRLGRRPVEVAKAVGIGESYMSSIISGKKNGTPSLIFQISEELGVTVNDLFRRPPSSQTMETVGTLSPAEAAILARALESISKHKNR